jgi:hypothetical protein
MAEVFLDASPEQRGALFSTEVLYTAPLGTDELATSVYGVLVPRAAIPAPNGHLLQTKDGEPVLLDGEEIDRDPGARLASRAQRVALAFRDRHCSRTRGVLGRRRGRCMRITRTAFRDGGVTVVKNLSLLCSEHHTVVHQVGRS